MSAYQKRMLISLLKCEKKKCKMCIIHDILSLFEPLLSVIIILFESLTTFGSFMWAHWNQHHVLKAHDFKQCSKNDGPEMMGVNMI